jgi:hypothetical protein
MSSIARVAASPSRSGRLFPFAGNCLGVGPAGIDSREMLVARLRAIATAMNLSPEQRSTLRHDVRISDVSGQGLKLTYNRRRRRRAESRH